MKTVCTNTSTWKNVHIVKKLTSANIMMNVKLMKAELVVKTAMRKPCTYGAKTTATLTTNTGRTKMKIQIIKGDITQVKADVVVNAANNLLRNGAGVCGAVHKAAGPELEEWCNHFMRNRNEIEIGTVPISPSFNMENCSHIAHTVGPIYQNWHDLNEALLEAAYHSTFIAASKMGATSIAFPCISTGIYGYPPEKAVKVVRQALLDTGFKGSVKLVCFSDSDYALYKKVIKPFSLKISKTYRKFL